MKARQSRNSQLPQGAFLPPEDVISFDQALDKLEQASQTLQVVASEMKFADATNSMTNK
jgi:hypothetical protein